MGAYIAGQMVWVRVDYSDEHSGDPVDPARVELHVNRRDRGGPITYAFGDTPARIVKLAVGSYEARFQAVGDFDYYWRSEGDGRLDARAVSYSAVGQVRFSPAPF